MQKILHVITLIFALLFLNTIANAEGWECAQCGTTASGNFCSNCGISVEESTRFASNESVVTLGHTVIIDDICEFTIDEASFTKKLEPENPASFYTYYEADDGKQYFYLKVSYKNLEPETVSMEGFGFGESLISGELVYADKYKYSGFLCYEEDLMGIGGSFTSAIMGSIDPLCTEVMYYLFEVPDSVCESSDPVIIYLNIGNNDYELVVR